MDIDKADYELEDMLLINNLKKGEDVDFETFKNLTNFKTKLN